MIKDSDKKITNERTIEIADRKSWYVEINDIGWLLNQIVYLLAVVWVDRERRYFISSTGCTLDG